MFSFADKTALIIGAGANIGRAVALEFARRGAAVAAADINAAGAAETAALIIAAGSRAIGLSCDNTSEDSLAAAIAGAEKFFGPIDILMNNAGIIHSGNLEDIPPAEWLRLFNVNLFGAVRANYLALPKMLARGAGYIVNTASFGGLYPYATNRIAYAASKAALISMSENMAIHLLPQGVRVSCLCPGPVMTSMMDGVKNFTPSAPMRGPGADLAVFSPAQAATILADGMQAERIIIPTHEQGWETIKTLAAAPDDFMRAKIADYGAGRNGLPSR